MGGCAGLSHGSPLPGALPVKGWVEEGPADAFQAPRPRPVQPQGAAGPHQPRGPTEEPAVRRGRVQQRPGTLRLPLTRQRAPAQRPGSPGHSPQHPAPEQRARGGRRPAAGWGSGWGSGWARRPSSSSIHTGSALTPTLPGTGLSTAENGQPASCQAPSSQPTEDRKGAGGMATPDRDAKGRRRGQQRGRSPPARPGTLVRPQR